MTSSFITIPSIINLFSGKMKLTTVLAVLAFTSSTYGAALPKVEYANVEVERAASDPPDHVLKYWKKDEVDVKAIGKL